MREVYITIWMAFCVLFGWVGGCNSGYDQGYERGYIEGSIWAHELWKDSINEVIDTHRQ